MVQKLDIFTVDKIIVPVNINNSHWIVAVIFIKKKQIEIYDSMGSDGSQYLKPLFCYIKDEHAQKKDCPLPDTDA